MSGLNLQSPKLRRTAGLAAWGCTVHAKCRHLESECQWVLMLRYGSSNAFIYGTTELQFNGKILKTKVRGKLASDLYYLEITNSLSIRQFIHVHTVSHLVLIRIRYMCIAEVSTASRRSRPYTCTICARLVIALFVLSPHCCVSLSFSLHVHFNRIGITIIDFICTVQGRHWCTLYMSKNIGHCLT